MCCNCCIIDLLVNVVLRFWGHSAQLMKEFALSGNAGFDRERNCIVERPGNNVEHISGIAVLDNHGVNLVSSAVTALIAPYVALGIWRHFV